MRILVSVLEMFSVVYGPKFASVWLRWHRTVVEGEPQTRTDRMFCQVGSFVR
jgi:hypothetical protein